MQSCLTEIEKEDAHVTVLKKLEEDFKVHEKNAKNHRSSLKKYVKELDKIFVDDKEYQKITT